MSQLFLPTAAHKFLDENGNITRAWRSFFEDLFIRAGSYNSYSLAEAESSEFDDAGIEEIKGDVYRTRDDLSLAPLAEQVQAVESTLIGMREEMAALQAEIANAVARLDEFAQIQVELDGLKSGTSI